MSFASRPFAPRFVPAGVKPIYDLIMDTTKMPYLEAQPERFLRNLMVREACGQPPVTFQRVERIGNIWEALKGTQHHGFAVVQRWVKRKSRRMPLGNADLEQALSAADTCCCAILIWNFDSQAVCANSAVCSGGNCDTCAYVICRGG